MLVDTVTYRLEAVAYGYRRVSLALDSLGDLQQLRLALNQTDYQLKEVVIEESQPVWESTDTISFDLWQYADSTEATLEDLLKKLPGVQVSKDGKIKFAGTPVERLLLEGDDLSGKDYGIVSQSVPATMVERVQFVSNYVENQLLRGFDVPESLVVNIVLDSNEVKKPSGGLERGAGNADAYRASVRLLAILPKLKILTTGDYQSTGDPLARPTADAWGELADITTSNGLIDGRPTFPAFSHPDVSIPINLLQDRFNHSGEGGVRMSFRPGQRYHATLQVGAGHEQVSQEMRTDRIYVAADTTFEVNEAFTKEMTPSFYQVMLKQQLYLFPQTNLTTVSTFQAQPDRASSALNLADNYLDVSTRNQVVGQKHQVAWISRLNPTHVLVVDGLLETHSYDQTLQVLSESPRDFSPSLGQGPTKALRQSLRYHMTHVEGNARLLKRGKRYSLQWGVGGSYRQESLDSASYRQRQVFARSRLRWKLPGKLFMISELSAGVYGLDVDRGDASVALARSASPFVRSSLFLGQERLKFKWKTSWSWQQALPQINQLAPQPILVGYRTLSLGTPELASSGSHIFHGRLSYTPQLNPLRYQLWYVEANALLNQSAYLRQVSLSQDVDVIQQVQQRQPSASLRLAAGAERYLQALASVLKLTPNYQYASYRNTLNNTEDRLIVSHNLRCAASVKTATRFLADVAFQAEPAVSWVDVTSDAQSQRRWGRTLSAYGDLYLHFSHNITLTIRNEYLRIRQDANLPQQYVFSECILSWKSKQQQGKNLKVQLSGKNLTDTQYFGINQIGDYLSTQSRTRLRPRTFLLEGLFSF
jgi:hypothetical protein